MARVERYKNAVAMAKKEGYRLELEKFHAEEERKKAQRRARQTVKPQRS
jgi:hypothetical protein